MTKCERTDCRYFGRSTKTCDYRLREHRGRGCPIEGCTRYEKTSGDAKANAPKWEGWEPWT